MPRNRCFGSTRSRANDWCCVIKAMIEFDELCWSADGLEVRQISGSRASHLSAVVTHLYNDPMIETLMGLNVTDAEGYAQYRAHMKPLLEAHGGSFGLDLWVSEVLLAPTTQPFNRVFMIVFPSPEQREAFFANAAYKDIRAKYFEHSVSAVSRLGSFVTD